MADGKMVPMDINPAQGGRSAHAGGKKPTEAELEAELEAPTLAAERKAEETVKTTPLSQCVGHSDWRVRKLAYEKVAKTMTETSNEGIFKEYAPKISSFLNDKNSAAQSASLDIVKNFAEKAPLQLVAGIAEEVGKIIAEKCLKGGPKHSGAKRASAAVVAMVGADCGEVILKSFSNTGFGSKNAKIKLATALTITTALTTYGKKEVPIEYISMALHKLLQDPNMEVRGAGKKLAILFHQWTRKPASSLASGSKEKVLKELEVQFELNIPKTKPKPKPKLRTRSKLGTPKEEESDEEPISKKKPIATEMDLNATLKKKKVTLEETHYSWQEAYTSNNWKHHKAALDVVMEVIGAKTLDSNQHAVTPRRAKKKQLEQKLIATGSESVLFPQLYDSLNNSKMPTVVKTCLELIMVLMKQPKDGSIRTEFCSEHAAQFSSALVKRLGMLHKVYDEKVTEAFEMMLNLKIVKITSLTSEINEVLKVKKPATKANVLECVAKYLGSYASSSEVKGESLKFFTSIFSHEINAASVDIRNAAQLGIAAVRVVAGEKSSAELYEKLDTKRRTKIEEEMEKIKKTREKSGAGKKGTTPKAKPKKVVSSSPKAGGPLDLTKILKLKLEAADKKVEWMKVYESSDWKLHKRALDEVLKVIGDSKVILSGSESFLFPRLSVLMKTSKMPTVVKAGTELVTQMVEKMDVFRQENAKSLAIAYVKRVTMPSMVYDKLVASALELLVSKKYVRMIEVRKDIMEAMKIRSPKAQSALMLAVANCVSWGVTMPELEFFGNWYMKLVNDKQNDVKNAALDGLSALWAAVGEKNVAVWIAKLDGKRLEKVAEGVARFKKEKNKRKPGAAKSPRVHDIAPKN